MESKHNRCSLLVTSCDSYDDAWLPYFELFKKMWPSCPFPIYLNTETKEYAVEGLTITCLHPDPLYDKKGKPISWSARLRQAVEKIDSPYILFSLEDFFLASPVRGDVVERCLDWMEQDETIAIIDFYRDPHEPTLVHEEFSEMDRTYDYAINAMFALWRKDFLLFLLRDENPWDFEFLGTRRWRRTSFKIYTHRKEFPPVFDYKIKPALGYGIYQGKWLRKNVELFSEHGITVDFEKRGFMDPPNLDPREREKNWLWHDVVKAIKSPKALWHYIVCTKNVLKDKIHRLKAFWLNW